MKLLTGIISVAIILFFTLAAVLWLYDVPLFSPELIKKLILTIVIALVSSTLLVLVIPFFFRDYHKGYNKADGIIAHKKQ